MFFCVEYLTEDRKHAGGCITSLYINVHNYGAVVGIYKVTQPLGLKQNFGFILTEEHDPYFLFHVIEVTLKKEVWNALRY